MDYGKLSIQELIDRCIARDERAWDEFLRRFDKHIGITCASSIRKHRRQPTKSLICDLKQNTYKKLCGKALWAFKCTHEKAIYGFLATTTSNIVHDYYRDSENRIEPIELPPDLPSPDSMKNRGIFRDALACLDRALDGEVNHDRDITMFSLFYWQGYRAREIAELNRLKVRQVENILLRLIGILRRNMNPDKKLSP